MRKTILLADDSVTIQKVVELTFMEEDLEVITVGTGDDALERLDEVAPDLVIADVHMPGPDGFAVCRKVKADRPRVPVLLLVGTFEPFDPNDVAAAGADAHLKKPFDSQELIRVVERLLAAGEQAPEPQPEPETEAPGGEEPAEAWPPAAAVATEADGAAAAGAVEEASPESDSPPAPEEAPEDGAAAAAGGLSDDDVDRVARRVVELLGPDAVRDVVWEVVPDLAEVVIKNRLRELERQVE